MVVTLDDEFILANSDHVDSLLACAPTGEVKVRARVRVGVRLRQGQVRDYRRGKG